MNDRAMLQDPKSCSLRDCVAPESFPVRGPENTRCSVLLFVRPHARLFADQIVLWSNDREPRGVEPQRPSVPIG